MRKICLINVVIFLILETFPRKALAYNFEEMSKEVQRSIILGIRNYPTNVLFAVTQPMRNRQMQEFIKVANERFPMYKWFGLEAFRSMIIGGTAKSEVAFLYESKRAFNVLTNPRPIYATRNEYHRSNHFHDGMMKLIFMEQVTMPLAERFDNNTSIVINGRSVKPSFETALADFNIDKRILNEVFEDRVFMRCYCGPFGIEEKTAKCVLMHNADDVGIRTSLEKEKFKDLLILSRREISEVIYWLWERKGRSGEYVDFVKGHPELFVLIDDIRDFKTMIGKMLVGFWE